MTHYDPVDRPSHYASSPTGIECIQAIRAAMTPEEFQGYLRGCCLKYLWRFRGKGGLQDLHKAQWYLNCLTDSIDIPPAPVEIHK
jgi:hypothetical protein